MGRRGTSTRPSARTEESHALAVIVGWRFRLSVARRPLASGQVLGYELSRR